MSVSAKPRKCAVRLTPEAISALRSALADRWQKDSGGGKLTYEAQAEILGVSVATVRRIFSGAGVDRATLALAYKRVGLAWDEASCEHFPNEAETPASPAPPVVGPTPTAARTAPRRRYALAGLLGLTVTVAGGQQFKGKDLEVCIRPFVWTKGKGYEDLWDLADRTKNIEPKAETFNVSAAVSTDGKVVATLGEKFYLLRFL